MGKKLFTISTAVALAANLLGGVLAATTASAAIEVDDTKYWSYEELAALDEEIAAQAKISCADKASDCEENFYDRLSAMGGIYGSVANFHNARFLISALNPTEGTMRVVYHNQTRDLYGEEPQALSELYVVWLEESIRDPFVDGWEYVRDGDNMIYMDFFLNAKYHVAMPGSHVLIAEDLTNQPAGWFPANTERTYDVKDADLLSNTRQKIFHIVRAGRYGDATNSTTYSSCFTEDYEPGMECRLYYKDGTNEIRYFPFKVEKKAEEETTTTPENTTSETTTPEATTPEKTEPTPEKTEDPETAKTPEPETSEVVETLEPTKSSETTTETSTLETAEPTSITNETTTNTTTTNNTTTNNTTTNTTTHNYYTTNNYSTVTEPAASPASAEKTAELASANVSLEEVPVPLTAATETTSSDGVMWAVLALLAVGDVLLAALLALNFRNTRR